MLLLSVIIFLYSRNWPTKQEEWINLIQRYWEQHDAERQNLQKILKDILDAMQQV